MYLSGSLVPVFVGLLLLFIVGGLAAVILLAPPPDDAGDVVRPVVRQEDQQETDRNHQDSGQLHALEHHFVQVDVDDWKEIKIQHILNL